METFFFTFSHFAHIIPASNPLKTMQTYNNQNSSFPSSTSIQAVQAPGSKTAENLDALIKEGVACSSMPLTIVRSFKTASCMTKLREALTPEVMASIMPLQNSPLGFRTDGHYSENVVKDALISAFMAGLMPVGNMWNIIGGRFYVTKEGFTHLLKKLGVAYNIDFSIPVLKESGAIVSATIQWQTSPDDKVQTKVKEFPIRVNKGMGSDAVLGKADRKAKAWLYNHLNQLAPLSDGDAETLDAYDIAKPATVSRKPATTGVACKKYDTTNDEPDF